MKYTLQEVKELLLKEIEETQQGTMMLINDDPDNNALYDTFRGLETTRENLDTIINNLIEQGV